MINKRKTQLIIIDLLGLTAHANFVTSLYLSCKCLVSHVCATDNAIDWNSVNSVKKTKLKLGVKGIKSIISWFFVTFLFLRRRDEILLTGCSLMWHVTVLVFASPKLVKIITHNEFQRISSNTGVGSKALKLIFFAYSLRGFSLAVMSSVAYETIVKRRMYNREDLYLITHPLPEIAHGIRFSSNGSINLLGYLRPQKLCGALGLLERVHNQSRPNIRIFGRYQNYQDVLGLRKFSNEFLVRNKSYTSHEEYMFLQKEDVYALVFCPDEKYDLLTSGSIVDAVRLGCYCLMPKINPMAIELIGNLVITNTDLRLPDPRDQISKLIRERQKQNLEQIKKLFESDHGF